VEKMVGIWDWFRKEEENWKNWDYELLEAAEYGDLIKVRIALKKGANPNARRFNGETPLHNAAQKGHVEIVKLLLKRGANPNAKDNYGWTPLHIAAQKGHVEIVKLLLEHGADPNAKDNYGRTPLHNAASEGYVDVVRVLLERGADPNAEDNYGWTPLHYAAYHGHVDVVRVLLERGADPNAEDNYGWTPLHKAASEGYVDVVRVLLERGANPNARRFDGETPLHNAAQKGHVDVVRVLLERGADPNAKNDDGWTPLHNAAQEGHVELVKLLLKRGANPNAKNDDGWTPLHNAAQKAHVEIVRVLLERGADPRIADNGGHIPLDYAKDGAIRSLLESALRNSYSGVPRELMQIPNYEVLEPIDEGGFAIVYKARREKDSSLVAIKVPKVPDKNFVKELAVWLHLNHPNIVKLIEFDINPRPYMVMELMNGTLQGKTFDKDTATRIILDVLSGLKYAHEKGIIHRDIKPSNILLDDNGRAKISDWGLAKFSGITTSTNGAFTLIYAAPEQLDSQIGPIDEETDVYQVCEVFYEILTGRPVFQGDVVEVHDKKLKMQITLPSNINPDLKDYDEIFLKCLSPKKEDRYTTEELISILSNRQITRLTSKNNAYAFVELAYYAVQYSNDYEKALFWIKKINTVDTKGVISSLEEKIKYDVGTKEDILLKIELLRNQISLSK
jgi:ankyrin repeat protein/serine/threonine protein kinase